MSATKISDEIDELLRGMAATVRLRRVEYDDLEMLRAHRNRCDVRCWLEHSDEITAEQQQAWWTNTRGDGVRIVALDRKGEERDIGLARLGPDNLVGCDSFNPGDGMGAVVLDFACRERRSVGWSPLALWVFLDNARAVALYRRAGFDFDGRTDVRYLMRDGYPHAYVRMVLP